MTKRSKQTVTVPESWIDKFDELSADNAAQECTIIDMEHNIQELIDCVMTQGKMLEDLGVQPLTPEVMIGMVKTLDAKEKKLSKEKEELKKSIIPDKSEWN